jgi:hypothetical protein
LLLVLIFQGVFRGYRYFSVVNLVIVQYQGIGGALLAWEEEGRGGGF